MHVRRPLRPPRRVWPGHPRPGPWTDSYTSEGNGAPVTARRPYAPRLPREERREQLLDAALAVIDREGYAGASIDAIAREAGVTRPVVYSAFENLADLLYTLLDRHEQRALTQLLEALSAEPTATAAAGDPRRDDAPAHRHGHRRPADLAADPLRARGHAGRRPRTDRGRPRPRPHPDPGPRRGAHGGRPRPRRRDHRARDPRRGRALRAPAHRAARAVRPRAPRRRAREAARGAHRQRLTNPNRSPATLRIWISSEPSVIR